MSYKIQPTSHTHTHTHMYIYMMYGPFWTTEELGFDSGQKQHVLLFSTASRRAPKPTQRSIQRGLGGLSLGVKRLRYDVTTHFSLVPRLSVRDVHTSAPPVISMASCLVS
jgi:hypothetical protein